MIGNLICQSGYVATGNNAIDLLKRSGPLLRESQVVLGGQDFSRRFLNAFLG